MKLIIHLFIGLIFISLCNAQSNNLLKNTIPKYKRIVINNIENKKAIQLQKIGIDLSCGAIFKDGSVILELDSVELNLLNYHEIKYDILIDDLINFYRQKNNVELPRAKEELERRKSISRGQRSFSTDNVTIGNLIQYEGCSEINWSIPNNFKLGSMGGCLTYSEVLAELDLMRSLYPNLISVKTDASPAGQKTYGNSFTNSGQYDTWSGQTVYYVRISDNPDVDEISEPESLYSGMTHAREVSSMMNLMYYMWYVLENYDSDPGIKNLVDNSEMYFIPVANPDGLLWNEQIAPNGGGLQRKNLGPYNTGNNSTRGVDLNRNYDYFWGPNSIYGGSSGSISSNVYRGPSAFSEPETQIIRDFSATKNFKTAMNHHATSNLIPHAYNGYPNAPASGREAEYAKFCHDMTRFNRYIYGEAPDILTIANGDMSDWMLGGLADVNGSTGSGQQILALAPENGAWDGSEGGFWPNPTDIVNIAERAVRMNFVNAYYSGKFAQFHDLNSSNISSNAGNLEFGIEYLGQTLGNITLDVSPISNISTLQTPSVQTGWNKLEQRTVLAHYTLSPGIQPNDEIEFQVTLSNDDGYVMYQANIKKIYQPNELFIDNPDITNLNNWTSSGGAWGITTDAYSGIAAITDSPVGSYTNNTQKTLTLNETVNLESSTSVIIQFFAKWDLERNFDYLQFEGSIDGNNWVPLCGKYTKPGSDFLTNRYSSGNSSNTTDPNRTSTTNQPSGESLYDGNTMNKWIMEEVLINASENSFMFGAQNAQFRFVLDSDNTNRADGYPTIFDGFTFDDFKILTIQLPCDASNPPSNVTVSNITSTSANVNWDIVPSATYDLRYRRIGTSSWITVSNLSTNSFTIGGLSATTNYEVQVNSKCDTTSSPFSSSTNFTTTDNVLSEGFFETGLDGWTDGGNDVARVQSSNSSEGLFSIRLRDNSGTASSMTSPVIDATGFDSLEITFNFLAISMETGENFFVEFFNGSNYQVVDNFVSGSNFSNGSFFSANVTVDASSINFTSNARFRIRCDASNNNDQIFIDEVIINGVSSGPETIPPIITLIGPSSIDLNIGEAYLEQGATATDNVDGDLTSSIIISGTVDTSIEGVYVLDYSVSDTAGNSASVSRTVNVIADTTAPVITLNGDSVININVGGLYTELGAMATDNVDGDLTGSINTTGSVDTVLAGTYIINYSVNDAAGNSASEIRTVNVIEDVTAPVIVLNGSSTITLELGEAYNELSATATDNVDGDLTSSIAISGTVDINIAGTYILTYSVSDATGNNSSINRVVIVNPDITAPVITLNGNSVIDINIGDSYTDLGATAIDNFDGDLTSNIIPTGTVNTTLVGTYIITYSVTDAAGNLASENRTVNVNELALDQILSEGFFETGLDGWMDGGNDVARVQTSASFEGFFSIRIRDNSGAASTMTSPSFNLTSFNQVNISFYVLTSGFSTGEDIILSYFNGSSWVVVQQFFANSDFFNNSFYFADVTLSNGLQNFSSNSRFRIQSDGSNNRDQAFVDQVIITGINNPAARSTETTATMTFVKEATNVIDLDLGLSIYPNPVTGAFLNIKSDESASINYRIYNILGKTVLTGTTTNQIDVSKLSKGIYVIDFNDGTSVLKQKFVKD